MSQMLLFIQLSNVWEVNTPAYFHLIDAGNSTICSIVPSNRMRAINQAVPGTEGKMSFGLVNIVLFRKINHCIDPPKNYLSNCIILPLKPCNICIMLTCQILQLSCQILSDLWELLLTCQFYGIIVDLSDLWELLLTCHICVTPSWLVKSVWLIVDLSKLCDLLLTCQSCVTYCWCHPVDNIFLTSWHNIWQNDINIQQVDIISWQVFLSENHGDFSDIMLKSTWQSMALILSYRKILSL